MAKKINIKEIAAILNVSISTVSKALNDSHEISAKTKKRVKETAELYNYRPDFIAKSLKDRSTKTIGVIVPDILNYFFVKVLYGIEKECRNKGYKVVTCISHESHEGEVENVRTLTNGQVDGLLICPSEETQNSFQYDHIQKVIDDNVPVVTFDRAIDSLKCNSVVSNDFEAAYNATNYFVSTGCKSIALFTTHIGLSVMQDRIRGYTNSLIDHNLFSKANIFNFETSEDSEVLIAEILAENKVDAVLTLDELLSVKTVKVALQMKLAVPSDLRVIGFSNGEISNEFYPSISSVDQYAKKIGKVAAQLLIENIENSERTVVKSHVVNSALVHRDSSKV